MNRRRGRRVGANASAGFALIEVLVTMTVVSVGIVAVLSAALSTLALQKDAALRLRAGLILQDRLGEVTHAPYAGQAMRGTSTDGCFTWTVTAAPWVQPTLSDTDQLDAPARLYEVIVEVRWATPRGGRNLLAHQLVAVVAAPEATP